MAAPGSFVLKREQRKETAFAFLAENQVKGARFVATNLAHQLRQGTLDLFEALLFHGELCEGVFHWSIAATVEEDRDFESESH